MTHYCNTEEELLREVIRRTSVRDLYYFSWPPKTTVEYRLTVAEYGRWIRNTFGLWDEDCPLTFKHPNFCEVIIDGVDYNEYHPDAVSGRIIDIIVNDENSDVSKLK